MTQKTGGGLAERCCGFFFFMCSMNSREEENFKNLIIHRCCLDESGKHEWVWNHCVLFVEIWVVNLIALF